MEKIKLKLFIFLALFYVSLAHARDVEAGSIKLYRQRINEFFTTYAPELRKEENPTCKFPFAFGSLSAEERNDKYAQVAIKLTEKLMNGWIDIQKNKKRKFFCSGIGLHSELHVCPFCSLNNESRIVDAINGKSIIASEMVERGEPEPLETAARDGHFPFLRNFTQKELQTPIYGIEDSELRVFSQLLVSSDDFNTLFSKDASFKARPVNVALNGKTNEDYYSNPEYAVVFDAPNDIGARVTRQMETGQDFVKIMKKNNAPDYAIKAYENLVAEVKKRDYAKAETQRWFLREGMNQFFSRLSYDDLASFNELLLKEYTKENLTKMLIHLGFSPSLAAETKSFVETSLETEHQPLAYELFITAMRNIAFASSLLDLCSNPVTAGKKIEVRLGIDHSPGAFYLLQKVAPQLPVDPDNQTAAHCKLTPTDANARVKDELKTIKNEHPAQ